MAGASEALRDDLLTGAAAIADYTGWPVRRIYYAADQGLLPIFRVGTILNARKSELDRAFSAEGRGKAA